MSNLLDRIEHEGGSVGFAIVELSGETKLPSPTQQIDPAKLFAGMRVVVSETEERTHPGMKPRRAIRVRFFEKIKE